MKDFIRQRVSSIRISKGLSARKLSLELEMGSEYINQLECGRSNPSINFLVKFCEYFNISMSEFFDNGSKYPQEYQELFNKLNKLDANELQLVKNLIDSLSKNK